MANWIPSQCAETEKRHLKSRENWETRSGRTVLLARSRSPIFSMATLAKLNRWSPPRGSQQL